MACPQTVAPLDGAWPVARSTDRVLPLLVATFVLALRLTAFVELALQLLIVQATPKISSGITRNDLNDMY